tara:strand:- start:333 stop:476 length:144 start_codon:yes stop_codon:yes gene_type:complete
MFQTYKIQSSTILLLLLMMLLYDLELFCFGTFEQPELSIVSVDEDVH